MPNIIVCLGTELVNKKVSLNNVLKLILKISKSVSKGSSICIRGTMSVGDMRIIKDLLEKTNLKNGQNCI